MKPEPGAIRIRVGAWDEMRALAQPVRFKVFVGEQGVPPALELDDLDPLSLHAVALDEHGALGTGRLLPDGHIGRVAVEPHARGRGIGAQLVARLVQAARERGLAAVQLNAQVSAVGFYRRLGFDICGDEFVEAGIVHRPMQLRLASAPPPDA